MDERKRTLEEAAATLDDVALTLDEGETDAPGAETGEDSESADKA